MSEEKLGSGVKYDQGKLRYDLVPVDSLKQVVEIYTFGAEKYEPHNWRKGLSWSRIYGAIQRHLNSFWEGEEIDPESKKNHLAHAAWGTFTLLNYCSTRREFDDRVIIIKEDSGIKIKEVKSIGAYKLKDDIEKEINYIEQSENLSKKDKINVYLAGTTTATKYRKEFKSFSSYLDKKIIVRDPLEEVDQKISLLNRDFSEHIRLVEEDKKLMRECDIVVAYVQSPSFGTIMEIMYAYEHNIPVYLISTVMEVKENPWICSHVKYGFDSIEDCIENIKNELLK